MPSGAAIAMGAGAGLGALGAIQSAGATREAAQAQQRIAEAQYRMAEKAAGFATPTGAEMENLQKQMDLYEKSNANAKAQLDTLQEQIMNTYGKNVIESGNQLYAQIKGGASAATQMMNEKLERQRTQYQQQLIDKLGPGALTSSAGIQAMAAFNRQANEALINTQEQAVNNLVGRITQLQGGQSSALAGVNNINSSLSGMLQSIQGTQNQFQTRQANAWMGVADKAGYENIGALGAAQAKGQMWNMVGNLGGQVFGAGLGSALSKTPATQAAPTGITESPSVQSGAFSRDIGSNNFGLGGGYTFQPANFSESTPSYGSYNSSNPLSGGSLNFKPFG